MRYRLICFDAGFTLIKQRRTMVAGMGAALAREGIPPTDDALQRAWKVADRWFWEEYHRPDNDTWVSDARIEQTWRHYHQLMLQELKVTDSHHRIIDAVLKAYFAADNWQLYPDVRPTLEALKQQPVALGVVSDWSSSLPQILQALDISSFMTFVLASGAAGFAKPSPQFYQLALQAAGVAPHEGLMVGDSYHADVLGARSAGMDALLLDREGTATASDVLIIHSLSEVLSVVLAP